VIPSVVLLNEQVSAMEGLAVYRYDMAIRPTETKSKKITRSICEHLFGKLLQGQE
jgi:hypothetical protein